LNAPEFFATSLVSLALIRKGYTATKDVVLPNGCEADLIATRSDPELGDTLFVVEVKAVADERRIPEGIEKIREAYARKFGIKAHVAYFIDSSDTLIVDDELAQEMSFSDPDVTLKTIDAFGNLRSPRKTGPLMR